MSVRSEQLLQAAARVAEFNDSYLIVAKAKRSAKGENPILICQHGEFSEVIQMASVAMQNLQAEAVVNLVMHKMLTGDDGEQRIY